MHEEQPTRGVRGSRWVLFFFLRFLAASIILYLIYMQVGAYYTMLVAYGAKPLLSLFNYQMILERALKVTEEISMNPIVFLSLVAASWRIGLKSRLTAAWIGFLILTAANIATVFLIFLSAARGSELLWSGSEFFSLTINFFLPLLLWILLLPLKELFLPRRRGNSD